MKIAHFADLHINTSVRESNVTETIALFENALKNGAEHFCLTGDLSHNAEPEDFETLRYILEYFDLLKGEKTSIIIGNHDIFGGPQKAEDIFTFPQRCKDVDYNKNVDLFTSYFNELFDNCIVKPANGIYPFAKLIKNTLIVGLNSIDRYSSLKNPFASNGFIDEEQFAETENILKDFAENVKHRLILIHHHFNKIKNPSSTMMHYFWQVVEKQTMKLRNKKELFRLFSEFKIDLVLHGHIHETHGYFRKGLRFLNGGGCFNNIKNNELCYNMIDVQKNGITTEIKKFIYDKKKKKYLREFDVVTNPMLTA